MMLLREVLRAELIRRGVYEIDGKLLDECSTTEMQDELDRIKLAEEVAKC